MSSTAALRPVSSCCTWSAPVCVRGVGRKSPDLSWGQWESLGPGKGLQVPVVPGEAGRTPSMGQGQVKWLI